MSYSKSLKRLKWGHRCYLKSKSNPATFSPKLRKDLKENGQKPYAVIVTCGDSRVPVEHIFSAGIGELFVVRNAGNVIGNFEMGSVEYAVGHLGVPLVVVLGHTHCGAVHAAVSGGESNFIKCITNEISKALDGETDLRKCERLNASNSVKKLSTSPLLKKFQEEDKLKIISAIYDIDSANVIFSETEEQLIRKVTI